MRQHPLRTRIFAYFMSLLMIASLFVDFSTTAYAGTTAGSSGSISATGTRTGLSGGVSHIDTPIFRLGVLNSDPDLYNEQDGSYELIRKGFSHRFPDNKNGMFMVANSVSSYYTNGFRLGFYNAGTRELEEFSSSEATSRVLIMPPPSGSVPYNMGRDSSLNGWSFLGNAKYSAMVKDGTWTAKANETTAAHAQAIWSWILAPTGMSGGTRSYSINDRINQFISPHAATPYDSLEKDQQEEVFRGYLGLLFAGRALTPVGSPSREDWDTAITRVMQTGNLPGSGDLPSTIVIDTAMSISYTGSVRTILPTVDYFMFYTAVKSSYNLYDTTDLGEAAGDSYKMLDYIVDMTMIEDGSSVHRTSDAYDANNPFSHGSSAIAYPGYAYSTSGRVSGKWYSSSNQTGTLDTLILGNNPFGSGRILGFLAVSAKGPEIGCTPGDPVCDPPIIPPPECPEDASKCPPPSVSVLLDVPDEYSRPYQVGQSATINVATPLVISHDPSDTTAIANWTTQLTNNWQMLTVRFSQVYRHGTNAQGTVNLSKGAGQGYGVDSVWFIDWLKGKNVLRTEDLGTLTEPIDPNTKERFNYYLEVTFTYKSLTGEMKEMKYQTNTDFAEYYREPEPEKLDPIIYTSSPNTYAEIKDNSPDNEQWDAMAGVPSNKRLYLGVGGSEFIVDVELEYKEAVDSVWRTYRSYYTGTDDEFKQGDTAPNKSLGGHSVDPHNGGTYTKTWTGSIPNKATPTTVNGSGNVTANNTAIPDRSAYDTAKTEAAAYIAEVNGTTLNHMSASDKVDRTKTGWNARITTDTPINPTNTTASNSCWTSAGNPPSPVPCATSATANPSGPGSFTIVVTFDVPAHYLCGPNCLHTLPGIEDTWKQKITFDYMKISKVEVYKIDSGRITQVSNLFGAGNDTLRATITQGDPNFFYNIAQQNANGNDTTAQSSMHGRIRYSLDWSQHDTVTYAEGVRTSKSDGLGDNGNSNSPNKGGHANAWATGIMYRNTGYTDEENYHRTRGGVKSDYSNLADDKDVQTTEWKKFDERRKAENTATIISDMLILQTSSGDQSVLYFAKDSTPKQAQQQFDPVEATKEEMWDNNPTSAANWSPDRVYVGSYNGRYQLTGSGAANNQKYWGLNHSTTSTMNNEPTGEGAIATKFDSNGAGTNASRIRPSRTSKLYITTGANIVPTNQNGIYTTGKSDVFYERLLSWTTPTPDRVLKQATYNAQAQSNYANRTGLVFEAKYSDNHDKVNDVVIHTPVSVEDAMVISLPADRDQRTTLPPGSAADLINQRAALEICPLDPALCEFRVLNCRYHLDETLAEFDFTDTTASQLMNLTKGSYISVTRTGTATIGAVGGVGSGNAVNLTGKRLSFNLSDLGVTNPNKDVVSVEMDVRIPATSAAGRMLVSFDMYTLWIPPNSDQLTLSTGKGPDIVFSGTIPYGSTFRLRADMSLGSAKDSKLFINGSERTPTVAAEPNQLLGRIGTKLHIGVWGTNDAYDANFVFDNMKITKKGGTNAHTEACYIYTEVHDTKLTHVHNASCWGVVDGVTRLVCNNLPLNSTSQNNVHVHDDTCINPDYIDSLIQKAVVDTNASVPMDWDFAFTNAVQTFTAPKAGTYNIELWGAQGGNSTYDNKVQGGLGGYSTGKIALTQGETLSIYVGGQNGWNGGGAASSQTNTGGGATDVRKGGTSLANRIIVAGGGGATEYQASPGNGGTMNGGPFPQYGGGHGGGTSGLQGLGDYTGSGNGAGGTQSSGYTLGSGEPSRGTHSGAGGGGYYGGYAGQDGNYAGGGGSGYVGGVTGGQTIAGATSMPSSDGGTQSGQTGNGFARISIGGSGAGGVSAGTPIDFDFTGGVREFTAPYAGTYQLEVWGAQGGIASNQGGLGGYSKGKVTLLKDEKIYVYVGGTTTTTAGGWNGGGSTGGAAKGGGGGTDIRKGGTSYSDRIIVAGGGGGAQAGPGGYGGGTSGGSGSGSYGTAGNGGTQSSGGSGGSYGSFGVGGNGLSGGDGYYGGGGGGGYYGGGGATSDGSLVDDKGGGGGSGFIGGVTEGEIFAGNQSIPNPSGGTMTGKSGNGYARITPLTVAPVENSHNTVSETGIFGYTWAQVLGANWSTMVSVSNSGGMISVSVNKAAITARANQVPRTLPDGSTNPFLICSAPIGGNSSLGPMATAVMGSGAEIIDAVHPTTGQTFKTLRLPLGANVPYTSSEDLNLVPNAEYIVEFDYWTSGGSTRFNVDLHPDTLPEHHLTAKPSVQSAKLVFKSSHPNMTDAVLRFFNDLTNPNPTNVYITGIKLYAKPVYNAHEHNDNCKLVRTLDCTEPHHSGLHYDGSNTICWDACGIDHNHKKDKENATTIGGDPVVRGTFINLDYGFQVYFPNIGDFAESPTLRGIPALTSVRGFGYNNDMDTTQYTAEKRIKFGFNVIYEGVVYRSGAWISLPVNQVYFDFYAPLANKEAVGASIQYEAIPINGRPIGAPLNENFVDTTNKARYSGLRALHGAFKTSYVDIIGRIGNFAIMDTEDFRFSNLFKQVKGDGTWQVEGLVPSVDTTRQNRYYGDTIDIRGLAVSPANGYLNTYGTQSWMNSMPLTLPINALDNTIPALQGEFLKIGYDILGDITTIGDYQKGIARVLPYYYKLDVNTGTVTPLDVYTRVGDEYEPINKYRAADSGTLPDGLAPYNVSMSWADEHERRNYSLSEAAITDRITNYYAERVIVGENVTGIKQLPAPLGSYTSLGNAQRGVIDHKARTFIGTSRTNGTETNIGNKLSVYDYDYEAQRWHLKFGLPSSAVFVPSGTQPTKENIDSVKSGNSLILLAADIVVLGDVYTLRWQQRGVNSFTVQRNGVNRTFNLTSSGLPPVIALYDTDTSSVIDITSKGSH